MALTVKLYSFSKRENSTKVPANTDTSTDVSVLLKEGTDIVNPVLILNGISSYSGKNYAYISDFSRYYFINKIEYEIGNRIFLYLTCDVMGSFKSEISGKEAILDYVYKNASDNTDAYNDHIPDARIPVKTQCTLDSNTVSFSSDYVNIGGANYFINVVGKEGCATYYVTRQVIDELYKTQSYDDNEIAAPSSSDTVMTILRAAINALLKDIKQVYTKGYANTYIMNAYILPISPNDECLGSSSSIYLGQYDSGKSGQKLVDPSFTFSLEISIPWQSAGWKRKNPYTKLYMYLPLFGIIDIPTDELVDVDILDVVYAICYSSGDLVYKVQTHNTGRILSTASMNVSSPYQIGSDMNVQAQHTAGWLGALGKFTGGISFKPNTAGLDDYRTILGADIGMIANTMNNFSSHTNACGLGGFASAELDKEVKLWTVESDFTDTQTNLAEFIGYPKHSKGTISSFKGFIKTADFKFDSSTATAFERDKITAIMNTGFYLE